MYPLMYSKIAKIRSNSFPTPKLMLIETCSACNLRCRMCPATLERQGQKSRGATVMDMSLYKKIIDQCSLFGITHINLNFYNEPLLDPLLFDRIAYAKSKNLIVSMFTNATLLTEDKIERLLSSGIDLIVISIDGVTKKTYEKIRRGADFNMVIKNVLNLVKARNGSSRKKPLIQFNMAITSDNIGEVAAFKSFSGLYADNCEVCPDRTMGALPRLLELKTNYAFPCRHLWEQIVVMADGNVPLCSMDYNCSVKLGDLSKQSLNKVLSSKTLNDVKKLHMGGQGNRITLCAHCDALYVSNAINWLKA